MTLYLRLSNMRSKYVNCERNSAVRDSLGYQNNKKKCTRVWQNLRNTASAKHEDTKMGRARIQN